MASFFCKAVVLTALVQAAFAAPQGTASGIAVYSSSDSNGHQQTSVASLSPQQGAALAMQHQNAVSSLLSGGLFGLGSLLGLGTQPVIFVPINPSAAAHTTTAAAATASSVAAGGAAPATKPAACAGCALP